MRRYAIVAVRMALVTLVLLGVVYPLVMTGVAQIAFPRQANGSLVRDTGGRVVGSELIGQRFSDARHFHGRPSAAGKDGYDAASSGASNLAPTSRELRARVAAGVAAAVAENPGLTAGRVPVDMVTTSGSGLDPDITPANAFAQIPRVAAARGMTEDAVRRIVERNVTPRQFGFLGEARVNVLRLNLDLDGVR
jgi:potassium-transporting ATPase KdpC subunit